MVTTTTKESRRAYMRKIRPMLDMIMIMIFCWDILCDGCHDGYRFLGKQGSGACLFK